MTTKADKVRVGLFTVSSLALLAIVLVAFGGLRFWQHRDEYTVRFDGSVMGLSTGAQVFLNGIKVGAVDDISPDPQDLGKVRVTLSLDPHTPIHTDTRAMLQIAGITGLKVVDLRGGSRSAPRLTPGGEIQPGETLLDKLEQRALVLVDESSKLVQRSNEIIDNLETITDPAQFEGVAELIANARVASKHLASAGPTIERMIATADQTATRAKAMLDGQVTQLLTNANTIVGDLKRVVHSNEGIVRSAVFDLRQASRSLKDLAREVRQRPSRLLFSDAAPERRLP
ncbi:MAG: MlaD family protein [Kofleriaceae bacterium]